MIAYGQYYFAIAIMLLSNQTITDHKVRRVGMIADERVIG